MAEKRLLAFGAYVSNVSTSIGWGGQGGSMQMKLVEDPDGKDEQGNPAPVLLDMPEMGSPVYFKYGNFYFGGIFQRYTYKESVSGGRIYDIVIESPSKLMDGVQVILQEFNGQSDFFMRDASGFYYSTNVAQDTIGYSNIENIFNVYGYYENPIGSSNFFGASNDNSSGLESDRALYGLAQLTQRPTNAQLAPFAGLINLKGFKFSLDVSDLLAEVTKIWDAYDDAYRVKGPVKTVNGICSDICETIQLDYFYDIMPVQENGASIPINNLDEGGHVIKAENGLYPEIKVRVVSKQQQPTPGAIKAYIQQNKPSGKVVSYSMGEEYAYATTQRMVWGGARTRYQAVPIASCIPIWGKRSDGSYLTKGTNRTYQNQYGNASNMITIPLGGKFGGPNYTCSMFEIRMALGGKTSWEIYKTFETMAGVEPNGFTNMFTCPWTGAFGGTKDILNLLQKGAGNAYDTVVTSKDVGRKQYQKNRNKFADEIYQAVSQVASNYYCQQFLAPMAVSSEEYTAWNQQNRVYLDPSAGQVKEVRAWEIADSAFLENPVSGDLAMFDGDGKQKALSAWTNSGSYDYSSLGSDYAFGTKAFAGNIVSTKIDTNPESIWLGTNTRGTHWVPIKAGAQIKVWDYITTPDFGLSVLAAYFFGIKISPEYYLSPGFNGANQFAIPPDNALPSLFGVPQESTRWRYGPWLTVAKRFGGTYSPEGKAECYADESLRPETFGGYANLQAIGSAIATLGTGQMASNESGFLEVVGKPEGSIGERFAASGPYCTNLDVTVSVTDGIKTTYKFNTWTPNFGKLAKYNIDRISGIGKAGWSFAQKQRGKIEKRPLPKFNFEKANLDLAKKKRNPNIGAMINCLKPNQDVDHKNLGQQGGGGRGDPGDANFGNLG